MASSQSTTHHGTKNSTTNPVKSTLEKNRILCEWKRSRSISHILLSIFGNFSNPYNSFLTLLNDMALDKYHQSKFVAVVDLMTEEFHTFIKLKESEYEPLLTDDLKINAMELLATKKLSQITIDIIIKVYRCDNNLDIVEKFIRDLISQRKYINACYASMYFKIQNRFTIEDFIVPLYLLNLTSCTDKFLATTKYHQEGFVKYFDDLLSDKDTNLFEIAKSYNVVPVNLNDSVNKTVASAISRCMKMFNVSIEFAPNLAFQMKQTTLRNLMSQCATEGVGTESWREMITSLVGDDMKVKLYLIKLLDENQIFEDVDYFAKLFSSDASLSSPSTQQILDKIVDLNGIMPNENNVVYHKLLLPENQVHMVDSMEKFDEFLDKLNSEFFDKHLNILGLDCEWKPQVLGTVKTLATIQLATIDSIYIFHIPQLQPTALFKLQWETFAKKIFENKDVVKLGYDWKNDVVIIQDSLPMENVQLYGRGFVDLKLLWEELKTKWELQLPQNQSILCSDDRTVHTGLSRLVKLFLGNPLKKTDRFSNWENVPLRLDQVKYAALDAYCLLEIYNALKALCKNENIPFEKVCATVSTNQFKIIKRKPISSSGHISNKNYYLKLPSIERGFRTPHNTVFNVKDIKLVIIDELEELAQHIRIFGLDTTIIVDSKRVIDSKYIKNIIQAKNVFFITMGDLYAKEIGNANKNLWYSVSNHKLEHQVFQVLNYFKVLTTQEDLFTRCQFCNSSSYETVSCETMESIFYRIVQTATCPTSTGLNENSDACCNEDLSSGQVTNGCIKKLLLRGYTKENCEINVNTLTKHSFNEEDQIFVVCNSCGSVVIDKSSKKHLVVI